MGFSCPLNSAIAQSHRTHAAKLIVVHRLPETVAYNLVYFVIGLGLSPSVHTTLRRNCWLFLVAFLAVMVSKMQASIADAIHDYDVDRANPQKSSIAAAVEYLGIEMLASVTAAELTIGIALWGLIALETKNGAFIALGVAISILGFTYSYPPRLKERGIINHLTTTGVDVIGIVLPVATVAGAPIDSLSVGVLVVVFLYAFGYHIVHQAADTVYDRQSGVSTFTQSIGISRSVWLAGTTTALSSILAAALGLTIAACGLTVGALAYLLLAVSLRGEQPEDKCKQISRWFRISIWATALNGSLAISLFV